MRGSTNLLQSRGTLSAEHKLCVHHGAWCYQKACVFLVALQEHRTRLQKQHVSFWLLPANSLKSANIVQTSPLSTPNPQVTKLTSTNNTLKKNDKIITIFSYTGNDLLGIRSVAKPIPSEPTVIFKSLLVTGHIRILHFAMREKANSLFHLPLTPLFLSLPHTHTHFISLLHQRMLSQ